MPSQLYTNEAVSFICAKNFTYAGVDYKMGDDFDQANDPGRLETLVRNRFLVPVVDELTDKPRHWHREVKKRDEALKKMGRTGGSILNREKQIDLKTPSVPTTPAQPSTAEKNVMDMEQNIRLQNQVAEENRDEEEKEEIEATPVEPLAEPEEGNEVDDLQSQEVAERKAEEDEQKPVPFSPDGYTVNQVLAYVDENPSQIEKVIEAEESGKDRSTLVEKLYERLERRDG